MAAPLPRLRVDLDMMPSPVPERPGLLVRDPYGYAEEALIIPPPLVPALLFFDGRRSDLELREALVRSTGRLEVGELIEHLRRTLEEGGFVHGERLDELRERRHRSFAAAPTRPPHHAGTGYPEEREALCDTLTGYLDGAAGAPATDAGTLLGIAAPHVSPAGGWRSYADAYAQLKNAAAAGRTFVVLGTSHYGLPNRFGLTRKPFATPLGSTEPLPEAVDALLAAAPDACVEEDYCHAVEHSIEFQVVFLQHVLGPGVRVLPILCGPFLSRVAGEGFPEQDDAVAAFLDALADWARAQGERVAWVLGVDLAHIGRRYGDRDPVEAGRGAMRDVERRDRERLARIVDGDADGFWELVRENGDELRWCGASALYTFLRVAPSGVRGRVARYEQWNIDETSVVSFAALAFARPAP